MFDLYMLMDIGVQFNIDELSAYDCDVLLAIKEEVHRKQEMDAKVKRHG